MLDDNPDALDPRADLERLFPHKCPNCGSSNISNEADDEGLIDCFECGIWFDPLHPDNAPQFPGLHSRVSQRGPQAESLDDEITDYLAYAMEKGVPPRVAITFSRTTPESVEQGDFSESGWIDQEGVDMTPEESDLEDGLNLADVTVRYLHAEGCYEASASHFHPGVWYSTEWSTTDYRTGEQEERNYHLVGFTEEQEREVFEKFKQR